MEIAFSQKGDCSFPERKARVSKSENVGFQRENRWFPKEKLCFSKRKMRVPKKETVFSQKGNRTFPKGKTRDLRDIAGSQKGNRAHQSA